MVCGNIPYHWGVTCSAGQYIERIATNGTPTCKTITSLVSNIDCPANQFIYRHSNGSFSCRGYIDSNVFGKSCPIGQGLRGFDSVGKALCYNLSTPIIKQYSQTFTNVVGATQYYLSCPTDSRLTGGGCAAAGNGIAYSWPSGNGWGCGKVYGSGPSDLALYVLCISDN